MNVKMYEWNEDFLQYLWKTRSFDHHYLQTTDGEPLEILRPGLHNTDSGPDFFNARVRISNTLWAGNVEVHTRASDWLQHGHQHDEAYDNVILHVVYENDRPILRNNGAPLPTLELKGRIDQKLWNRFQQLCSNNSWVPCATQLKQVDALTITGWTERLLVERLEMRADAIIRSLQQNNNDWEETFYQQIARYFGMKVNADPFEWLAKAMPYKILSRHKNSQLVTEALLFGQSGLLPKSDKETYVFLLQREYRLLKQKYRLERNPRHQWKFMRMRPANFPTIRIAQLAALLRNNHKLFRSCMEAEGRDELYALFDVTPSAYWSYHYRFGTQTRPSAKTIGANTVNTIIINTIIPFLFVYGKKRGDETYTERALRLLEQVPPEDNAIIEGWKNCGWKLRSAFDSQALLQLKEKYCNEKRCLHCAIGNRILKNV
jgi:hypothetical protein